MSKNQDTFNEDGRGENTQFFWQKKKQEFSFKNSSEFGITLLPFHKMLKRENERE